MKCLVLGSDGLVGKYLCNHLQSKNETVVTYDITENPDMDLRRIGYLDDYMKDADFVYFLAFDIGGAAYIKTFQNTFQFIDNNTKIMETTFNALKRHGKPFIFTSSTMASLAFSSYGVLKSVGEFYTRSLNGLVVKFWNIYGIEHNPISIKTHVVSDFIKMALIYGEIRMQTDGAEERQFLYGEDCSEAMYTLQQRYDSIPRNKPLDISRFEWTKINDLANIISETCNNAKVTIGKEKDMSHQKIKNEPDPYILSMWNSKTNLRNGVEKIVNHYKQTLI
jgi:nucleoside-diphosphate-sugar epimerase